VGEPTRVVTYTYKRNGAVQGRSQGWSLSFDFDFDFSSLVDLFLCSLSVLER